MNDQITIVLKALYSLAQALIPQNNPNQQQNQIYGLQLVAEETLLPASAVAALPGLQWMAVEETLLPASAVAALPGLQWMAVEETLLPASAVAALPGLQWMA